MYLFKYFFLDLNLLFDLTTLLLCTMCHPKNYLVQKTETFSSLRKKIAQVCHLQWHNKWSNKKWRGGGWRMKRRRKENLILEFVCHWGNIQIEKQINKIQKQRISKHNWFFKKYLERQFWMWTETHSLCIPIKYP